MQGGFNGAADGKFVMKRISRILTAIFLSLALAFASICFFLFFRSMQEIDAEDEFARIEYTHLREQVGVFACVDEPQGIDWAALRAINPDVVGWIEVPGTTISYPIVQGTDNDHYLYHTFTGARNASGAIFLDHRDSPDFHSRAMIYGHNVRNGSMFAPLLGWVGDIFLIHTPEDVMKIAVTWRGVMPLADIVAIEDDIVLVTCVNGRPDVRWVVRGNVVS